MSCIQGLLEKLAPEIEAYLRPRLQGFLGAFVRAYLPQHWSFETEEGTTTVRIDASGAVSVLAGAVKGPDVSVRGPHARLKQILTTRERPGGSKTDLVVTAHSAKGRAALEQVRQRFGL